MKKAIFCFLLGICFFNNLTYAQAKKFRWESEGGMCEYEGTFDSKKFNLQQIRNTEKLVDDYFNLDLSTATVWKYEEIGSLNFAPVEAEYRRKSAELKNLEIVKLPYWEKRKAQKLKELESYYRLVKTTMASYKTPASLREYPFADSCKTKFAEPLIAGGDSLLNVWEAVNLENRKVNSDPARLKRIFDEQRGSTDALKFAVVEVTAFGWWNCANAEIDQGDDYGILERNFRKLFTRVRTIRCEEP